ncbi:MAG: hypothetical protein WD491_12210 [Balneolales bacterium]
MSEGLTAEGNVFHMREDRQVPYHQPLPDRHRNNNGDYLLSPDGRFYSKMDFANRPKDYLELRSLINVTELTESGSYEIEFVVDRTDKVDVTIELCFRKGGEFSGVTARENDTDGFYLSSGYGSYRVDNDIIEFGPGRKEHTRSIQANEQYSVHNGGIHLDGYRVYITGQTPFRHTLKIL